MSSNNFKNNQTFVEESEVINEIQSFLKAGKIIIPFSKDRLPSGWSPGEKEVAFVDLVNYQAIEEYNPLDQIITVQCGIKIKKMQEFLARNKQWLPVSCFDDRVSLLDLILTGDAGPLEMLFGGLRRHILGLSFILSNGELAKSGGRVVKNVTGYDLTRFLIGSYGYFALPVRAHLRIYALPEFALTISVESDNIVPLISAANQILSNGAPLAYMDIFDSRLYSNKQTGKAYLLALKLYGIHETVEAEMARVKQILAGMKLKHHSISETKDQTNLLEHLARLSNFQSNNKVRIVELSLDGQEFEKLYDNANIKAFPFLYRPGSGRLCYSLNSSEEQNALLAILREYTQKNMQPLTVAYSDNLHIKLVKELEYKGISDSHKLIKRQLKEKFDPTNRFNPFVDL